MKQTCISFSWPLQACMNKCNFNLCNLFFSFLTRLCPYALVDVKLHTLRSFFLFPRGAMERKHKLGSLKRLLCPYNDATLIANLQQWRLPSHFRAIHH